MSYFWKPANISTEFERQLATESYDPGAWWSTKTKAAQTFDLYTTPGMVAFETRVANAEKAAGTYNDEQWQVGYTAGEEIPNPHAMTEEAFKSKGYDRNGAIKWTPRMTEQRAQITAEEYDKRQHDNAIMERTSTPVRSALGFGAALIASLPDPINLVPVGGMAAKGAKLGQRVLAGAKAGAVGTALADAVVLPSAQARGEDVGFGTMALDMTFGALFGGAIGAGGHWLHNKRVRSMAPQEESLGKAFTDMGFDAAEASRRAHDVVNVLADTAQRTEKAEAVRNWLGCVNRQDAGRLLDKAMATLVKGQDMDVASWAALLRGHEPVNGESLLPRGIAPGVQKTFAEMLSAVEKEGVPTVNFGKLSPDRLAALQAIERAGGMDILRDGQLVLPSNVVWGIFNKGTGVLRGHHTADQLADALVDAIRFDRSAPVPEGGKSLAKSLTKMQDDLIEKGFLELDNDTGKVRINAETSLGAERKRLIEEMVGAGENRERAESIANLHVAQALAFQKAYGVDAVKALGRRSVHRGMGLGEGEGVRLEQMEEAFGVKPESMQAVRDRYYGTEQWMKAPNGRDTNLNEHQWLQVRTPEFKNWFGDWELDPANASKVVDENGEPLVVYHQTEQQFEVFDISKARQDSDIPAFFFSSGTEDWAEMGGNTIAAFLNMRNPREGKPSAQGKGREVRERLEREGYDGTIEREEDMETEFAVFRPEQVKSAIGNRGAFDPNNPNIFYQTAASKNMARMDAEYLAAVRAGDMETAQRMVNERATQMGYSPDSDYRMQHRAPDSSYPDEIPSLREVADGSDMVPSDFFTHPEYYIDRNDPADRESLAAIKAAIADLKNGGDGEMTMYRAVPSDVKEGSFRNSSWITPSKRYAEMHKAHALNGKGRIIEMRVKADDVWWDANSINEWGYDDRNAYAYRNTKNNRKLLDAVTRDENGNVIPLSKRFNYRNTSVLYQQAVEDRMMELFQRAWHGTPHKFDKFTLDHIGEGEGQQIHGWGLYFAQSREISNERYRKRLSGVRGLDNIAFEHNGEKLSEELSDHLVRTAYDLLEEAEKTGDLSLVRARIEREVERIKKVAPRKLTQASNYRMAADAIDLGARLTREELLSFVDKEYQKDALGVIYDIAQRVSQQKGLFEGDFFGALNRELRESADSLEKAVEVLFFDEASRLDINKTTLGEKEKVGQLFEVEIPENNVLLDEQMRISEQSPEVQKALRELGVSSFDEKADRALQDKLSNANRRFSEATNLSRELEDKLAAVYGEDFVTHWEDFASNGELRAEDEALYKRFANVVEDVQKYSKEVKALEKERRALRDSGVENGKEAYNKLVEKLGSPKEASLALKEKGVLGISYDGFTDGRCFVIWDEGSIQILDKLYQAKKQAESETPRGMVEMQRAEPGSAEETYRIFLGPNADASTVPHESAHIFHRELENVVARGGEGANIEQARADLKAIRRYAGVAEEGKLSADDYRKVQEAFARGFEQYLYEGKAPNAALEGVFRRMARWLASIYEDIKRYVAGTDGVELKDEIRQVYDRLLDPDRWNAGERMDEFRMEGASPDYSRPAPLPEVRPDTVENLERASDDILNEMGHSPIDYEATRLVEQGQVSPEHLQMLNDANATLEHVNRVEEASLAAIECIIGAVA